MYRGNSSLPVSRPSSLIVTFNKIAIRRECPALNLASRMILDKGHFSLQQMK